MSQIKPIQIIPARESKQNPGSTLPIDLNPVQRDFIVDPVTTINDPSPDLDIGETGSELAQSESTEAVLEQSDPIPATPAIIGVKEQIITFQPDGTARVDIVLEVQDIEGAVEYDVRVAKDAGNL